MLSDHKLVSCGTIYGNIGASTEQHNRSVCGRFVGLAINGAIKSASVKSTQPYAYKRLSAWNNPGDLCVSTACSVHVLCACHHAVAVCVLVHWGVLCIARMMKIIKMIDDEYA